MKEYLSKTSIKFNQQVMTTDANGGSPQRQRTLGTAMTKSTNRVGSMAESESKLILQHVMASNDIYNKSESNSNFATCKIILKY